MPLSPEPCDASKLTRRCYTQALELPENHGVRNELHATVAKLRQLPRVIAPPPPAGMNGNGSNSNGSNGNGNGKVPDGPAALLAVCRDLAMQVQVRLVQQGGGGGGVTDCRSGVLRRVMVQDCNNASACEVLALGRRKQRCLEGTHSAVPPAHTSTHTRLPPLPPPPGAP